MVQLPRLTIYLKRFQTLPPAQTSSAREAMQSFYCQLCSKGYSRMNDYEAHLSSYDHTHRQRLKDMKAMVKTDPSRTRKSEAKADGIISIKLGGDASSSGASGSSGFKKGGFKKTGFAPIGGGAQKSDSTRKPDNHNDNHNNEGNRDDNDKMAAKPYGSKLMAKNTEESDTEDEGYEVYDPLFPTE